MELVLAVVLLASYAAFVFYLARGGSLILGAFFMAVLWGIVAMVGGQLTFASWLKTIVQAGPTNYGGTIVAILFGSWFGRVLVETGIVGNIIKKTVELGGDKPVVTTVLLCIVSAAIFTSTWGVGVFIAVGLIVLPIMFSLGVSKPLSVASYFMAVGAGLFINRTQYIAVSSMFGGIDAFPYLDMYTPYLFTCGGIMLIGTIGMVIVSMRRKEPAQNWASAADQIEVQKVPGISLITPIIPVVILLVFKIDIIPALIASVLFAMIICGKFRSLSIAANFMQKTFVDGICDVAPMIGFVFFMMMFNLTAGKCAPYIANLLGGIIPTSALALCIMFGLLCPLGLFRGPFTLFGSGIAIANILIALGVPQVFVFVVMYVPTVVMNLSICPSQSPVMWGMSYAKVSTRDQLRQALIPAWIIGAACCVVVYIFFSGLVV